MSGTHFDVPRLSMWYLLFSCMISTFFYINVEVLEPCEITARIYLVSVLNSVLNITQMICALFRHILFAAASTSFATLSSGSDAGISCCLVLVHIMHLGLKHATASILSSNFMKSSLQKVPACKLKPHTPPISLTWGTGTLLISAFHEPNCITCIAANIWGSDRIFIPLSMLGYVICNDICLFLSFPFGP